MLETIWRGGFTVVVACKAQVDDNEAAKASMVVTFIISKSEELENASQLEV